MRHFFIFSFCLCLLLSCQKNEVSFENETIPLTLAELSQTPRFKVARLYSLIKVTLIKDENIPVKGTFHLKSGELDDRKLELRADLFSWDSGLDLRDERVRQIFFKAPKENQDFLKITATNFTHDMKNLREKKQLNHLKIALDITLNQKTVTKTAEVFAMFDETKGRLQVMSLQPVSLKISEFFLSDRLKELMEVCEHKIMGDEVAVDFKIEFVPVITESDK